jgi:hypothetical protein
MRAFTFDLPIRNHCCRWLIANAVSLGAVGAVIGCASAARPFKPQVVSLVRPLPECAASIRPVPRDSVASFGDARPPEAIEVRLSRGLPGGFTSVEGGPTGALVLQLVDTTKADTVRAALAAAYAANGESTFATRIGAARLRTVAFSAADVVDWHTYVSSLVFNEADAAGVPISGVGGDLHRVRIIVEVPTEAAREWVEARLGRAQLPCGLVETTIGGGSAAAVPYYEYRRPVGARKNRL